MLNTVYSFISVGFWPQNGSVSNYTPTNCDSVCHLQRVRKSCAFLTVEVKFQAVGIDMVQRNAKLIGYMLDDAAKPSRNEEDLHVAPLELRHKFPVHKNTFTSVSSDRKPCVIQVEAVEADRAMTYLIPGVS